MTGTEVQISWLFAFLAGVVSFISPCVLPLIPGYISLVTKLSFDELTESNQSETLKNLTQLTLTYNPVGPRGGIAIANSPALKNLTLLDLYEAEIGSEGGKAIAESKTLKNLETLVLSHAKI